MHRFTTLIAGLLIAAGAQAATFTVNSPLDVPDPTPNDGVCDIGGGLCTLRAAVQTANAAPGTDTVALPAGTYAVATPLFVEFSDLVLQGVGAAATVISGGSATRVLTLSGSGGSLTHTVRDLTIRDGTSPFDGGGIRVGADAILVAERIRLTANDGQAGGGGGIYVSGQLTLSDSTLDGNIATGNGAALRVVATGQAVVRNSTFSGNSITGAGGAALQNENSLELVNSTVSGNTAPAGQPAIFNSVGASLTIQQSTIAGNAGPQLQSAGGPGGVLVGATILADPVGGPNCAGIGAAASNNANLVSDASCGFAQAGDLVNVDPLLAPLANNGGPTQTRALGAGSPAIDAGANGAALPFDQRGPGFPRTVGAATDIGAFERAAVLPPALPPGSATAIPVDNPLALALAALAIAAAAWRGRRRT